MVEQTLTARQALEVMRVFIAQFKEKEPLHLAPAFVLHCLIAWLRNGAIGAPRIGSYAVLLLHPWVPVGVSRMHSAPLS